MKKVAVDEELSHLRERFKAHDLYPVPIGSEVEVSAMVITGRDENLMNIQDTVTELPVIDASGFTDEELIREVKQKINQME